MTSGYTVRGLNQDLHELRLIMRPGGEMMLQFVADHLARNEKNAQLFWESNTGTILQPSRRFEITSSARTI